MAAQLSSTAQGGGGRRVKLACNGGWGLGLDQNMQLFTSIQPHKLLRRRRCLRSLDSTRLYSSSSSSSRNKAKRFNSEAHLFVDGGDHDEGDGVHGGDDDGGHVEYYERDDDLSCFRGLVLDISYRSGHLSLHFTCAAALHSALFGRLMLYAGSVLFAWNSWRRWDCRRSVVHLSNFPTADVLEYYDRTVNSPSGSYYIPAVLRVPHLLQIVKRRRIKNSLSRKNILCRDSFTCQYCSSRENLTIDHVFPIARGGQWKWDNLVTACARCNSKKGQKTLEEANMKLMKVPKAPKDYDILAIPLTSAAIKMLKMRKGTPEEWLQYLSNSKPPPSSEP